MPKMLDLAIPASGDSATLSPKNDRSELPSTGREHSRWIQAPVARLDFTTVASQRFVVAGGIYASAEAGCDQELARNEIAEWRFSAAASFWKLEESLPEE